MSIDINQMEHDDGFYFNDIGEKKRVYISIFFTVRKTRIVL